MKELVRSMETDATMGYYLLLHTSTRPGLPGDCPRNYTRLTKEVLIYDVERVETRGREVENN